MTLLTRLINPIIEGGRRLSGSRTGTRTAADFNITLGFTPSMIKVTNLTTRSVGILIINPDLDAGANVKGLLQVAAGTLTYEDLGISLHEDLRGFNVVVATAALETDDSDLIWEAWL